VVLLLSGEYRFSPVVPRIKAVIGLPITQRYLAGMEALASTRILAVHQRFIFPGVRDRRVSPERGDIPGSSRKYDRGLFITRTELDFIEKYAASPSRLDVKDCFLPEDFVGSFKSEPEAVRSLRTYASVPSCWTSKTVRSGLIAGTALAGRAEHHCAGQPARSRPGILPPRDRRIWQRSWQVSAQVGVR
jgi:hypothetical protein